MKAWRDELPVRDERCSKQVIAVVAAVVFVISLLLYFGLRSPAEEAPQQAANAPASAVPATVDIGAAPAPAAAVPATANFTERQLDPPRPVVSAGEAPVAAESGNSEVFVIAGELLEEIEEDAEE